MICILPILIAVSAEAAETFEGYNFYIGDLHVHTGVSADGGSWDLQDCETCGSWRDVADRAKSNGMDFVAVTDHINGPSTSESAYFRQLHVRMVEAHDPDNGFVTIPAAEVHFVGPGGDIGHKNLYLFGDDDKLEDLTLDDVRFNGASTEVEGCDVIWDWMQDFEAEWGKAILIPHHPAPISPMPTDWTCHHETFQPSVEMYSMHGNSLFEGAAYDPPPAGSVEEGTVHHALRVEKYRLGFISSTDNHQSNPGDVCSNNGKYGGGLAIISLPKGESFSRLHLYQAILAHRTYASSGPLLPAVVDYYNNGHLIAGIGDEVSLGDNADLSAEVRVPSAYAAYVTRVMLMTPTAAIDFTEDEAGTWQIALDEVPEWAYPRLHIDGASWYGFECDDGGTSQEERIWFSPTWFISDEVEDTGIDEPIDEGCAGCSAGGAALGVWLIALPVALRRRRR